MKLTYILNKNKDGLIVTGGEDLKGELIIPFEDELNGKVYPVKEIGASFWNTIDSIIWDRPPLTSVFIPNSVTKIGNDAFSDCTELSSLDIPKSIIEIGRSAFRSCRSLSSIVIPASVTKIETDAFCGCGGLKSIVVEDGNRFYDSRENCNALIETATDILITGCSTTVIPDSVTKIQERAFCHCSDLASIVIPDSVTEIGSYAFFDCTNLVSVTLPDSVTKIGEGAFCGCPSLTNKLIPDSAKRPGCGVIVCF